MSSEVHDKPALMYDFRDVVRACFNAAHLLGVIGAVIGAANMIVDLKAGETVYMAWFQTSSFVYLVLMGFIFCFIFAYVAVMGLTLAACLPALVLGLPLHLATHKLGDARPFRLVLIGLVAISLPLLAAFLIFGVENKGSLLPNWFALPTLAVHGGLAGYFLWRSTRNQSPGHA